MAATSTHCFEILRDAKLPGGTAPAQTPPIIVGFGDDVFLRRETTAAILKLLKLESDDVRSFDGEECEWIDVHDELATLSLFDTDARRVAIVKNADKLVKSARPSLEKWFASPAAGSLLILQVSTFASNTNLFKLAAKNGWCIGCGLPTGGGRSKTPSLGEVKKWMVSWGKQQHGLKLSGVQATQIVDAVGPDCGLLHQELAKLTLYADDKGALTEELIRNNVGSWRTRTIWDIADAVADGRIAEALEQLERVFSAGEHPAAVVPQIAWSLRRFGQAANLILQARRHGQPLSAKAAIGQCGFWGRDAQLAEERLRRMGLRRASKLLDWLLELDLKTKGSHSQPTRAVFALEQLCLRFAD